MGWKDHLGAITGTALLPGFGTGVGAIWDKKQKDKKDAAQAALDQANADQQSRMAALQSGLATGEKRAEGLYGTSSDLAGRLASARKFSQEQMQKGFQAGEFDALRGQDIQTQASSLKGGMQNLQSKLASQGIRGGAAMKASAGLAQRSSQDLAQSDRARTALGAQLMRQGAEDVSRGTESDISRSQALRLAEGGLNLNAVAGSQLAAAQAQSTQGKGITVICTELHNQGILSDEIMKLDHWYGVNIRLNKPEVYAGYMLWAPTIVKLMKKSKAFTALVSLFAIPWAYNMAYNNSFTGKCISVIGEFACGILGKSVNLIGVKNGQKV